MNRDKILPTLSVAAISLLFPHAAQAEETPLTFEMDYTSEVWTIASGGIAKDERYLDNINVSLSKSWVKGTNAYVSGLYNNGHSLSGDLIGDAQAASNIEAPVKAARLYEAWIEQPIGQSGLTLKAGLLDVNTEFDALDSSGLFLGSAHGIGTDIAQSGENGPSIFPVTALGVRFHVPLSENLAFRVAVIDGTPGDPNRPKRTAIKLGGGDGAFMIGELDYALPAGKIIAGYWRYTAGTDTLASPFNGAVTEQNSGYYLRGESKISGGDTSENGLYIFGRLGFADGNINTFSSFYSAGLQYKGLFDTDTPDALGLAIAVANTSDDYRGVFPGQPKRETAIELTYQITLSDRVSLQPDVQYIINALEGQGNTVAIGLRAVFTLF